MSDTTPTGIPIIECQECGKSHPSGRGHCADCGKPSRFINPETVLCLTCGHAKNGHAHPAMAADRDVLPCHHEDGCEAFVPSDVSLPPLDAPPRHEAHYWPVNEQTAISGDLLDELRTQATGASS